MTALTLIIYALLNLLTDAFGSQQQQRMRHEITSDGQYSLSSSTTTRKHPVFFGPLVPRKAVVPSVTTETSYRSNTDNATEEDGADTGVEDEGQTVRPGGTEQFVRREVTRLRLRPPKNVKHAGTGQWQIVDVGHLVLVSYAILECCEPVLKTNVLRKSKPIFLRNTSIKLVC